MNFRGKQHNEEIEINLIPLIDVLLVILIFLAATTSFNRYQQLKLTLPHAAADVQQQEPMRIAITHEGLYAVQGHTLPGTTTAEITEALLQLIASAGPGEPAQRVLVIDADARTSHAAVVRAMEAARMAGIERVQFTTQAVQ